MKKTPIMHNCHAHSGNIPGLWQARCSCGWFGEILADEGAAGDEAQAHFDASEPTPAERSRAAALRIIAQHSDGKPESLDELRRRNPSLEGASTDDLLAFVWQREAQLVRAEWQGLTFLRGEQA